MLMANLLLTLKYLPHFLPLITYPLGHLTTIETYEGIATCISHKDKKLCRHW